MAKKKVSRSNGSGTDRDSFSKKQLELIKSLQDDVLRTREKLRNKTGALKEAQNQLYNGLAEGLQLEMRFGQKDDEEEGEEDDGGEPEDVKPA